MMKSKNRFSSKVWSHAAICVGLAATATITATLAVTFTATAEEAPTAMEILQRVDNTIKKVEGVSYKVHVEPGGSSTQRTPTVWGEGSMFGWDGGGAKRFYSRVEIQRPDTDERERFEGGGDGETYYVLDHGTKKAYEDIDPLVLGSNANTLNGLGMLEFVHPAPFDDELGAEEVKLLGTEEINGETCFKIHVRYSQNLESTWFFAEKDFLPRRRVRHFQGRDGSSGTLTITVSDLVLNPEPKPALFRLDLPKGYELIDDFAP